VTVASADFGAGAVAVLVAGGVLAAVTVVVFLTRWLVSLPDLPSPGPETSDLGPESPALANLLVNRCGVTTAAAAATLLDLAARRDVLLFEAGPGKTIVRTQDHVDEPLTDYEEQVLDLVREKATGGSAPLEAIELEASHADSWRKSFAKKVVADATSKGLVRQRWNRSDVIVVGTLASLALGMIALGLYLARVESNPDNNGISRDDWFWIAGVAWLALMAGMRALRAIRYSPAGEAAASRWLGVKRYLGRQDGFGDAPPASVAIWNRLLAYGAAIGVARGALDGIGLEVEDPDVAWSRYGGSWRQVRVEYPVRFGYGERPWVVLGGGLVRLAFWGAIGFVALPVVIDVLWQALSDALGGDNRSSALAGFVVVFTIVFGLVGAYLVIRIADGAVRTYRGLADLRSTRTVTGEVVKHHDTEQHAWFAVDPGGVDEVRAYFWESGSGGTRPARGSTVRVVLTPHLHHLVSVDEVSSTDR
jgi:hypothetical protein